MTHFPICQAAYDHGDNAEMKGDIFCTSNGIVKIREEYRVNTVQRRGSDYFFERVSEEQLTQHTAANSGRNTS